MTGIFPSSVMPIHQITCCNIERNKKILLHCITQNKLSGFHYPILVWCSQFYWDICDRTQSLTMRAGYGCLSIRVDIIVTKIAIILVEFSICGKVLITDLGDAVKVTALDIYEWRWFKLGVLIKGIYIALSDYITGVFNFGHVLWLYIVFCIIYPTKYHLNQWWNNVNYTLRNKLQLNFNRNLNIFIPENADENAVCEIVAILFQPQYVNTTEGYQ